MLAISTGQVAGAVLNPSTGKLRLIGTARYRALAVPASTGSDCYVKTEKNRKFKGYRPWHNTEQGKSFIIDWLNQLYSLSDARILAGEGRTYQVQFCSVGGGNTSHGWHQWFNGNALFYEWSMSCIRKHAVYFGDVVGIAGLCGELFGGCSKPFQ